MKVHAATTAGTDECEALASVKVFAVRSSAHIESYDRPMGGFGRVLISYVYDPRRSFPERLQRYGLDASTLDVLLDSGAFSVWSRGEEVDLDDYIEWCKAYRPAFRFTRFANLDVIPGDRAGGNPTKKQRDKAIAAGMENADRMRAADLPIVEAYHRFEPIEILDKIVERRRPNEIMAIGGLVGRGSNKAKIEFCDRIFARLRDLSGGWDQLVPVHGFGIAPDSPLAGRYPWYSIDAMTWLLSRKFGREVARNGLWTGRHAGPTIHARPVSDLYFQWTLANWKRLEETYTRLWQDRGVGFALEEEETCLSS